MGLFRLLAPLLGLPLLVASSLLDATLGKDGSDHPSAALPIVVNTWAATFSKATAAAWAVQTAGGSAVDAVVQGCTTAEEQQCDRTVGFGGSPDESGETTLDALIMDGSTMRAGAVSNMRRVRQATTAARLVMEHTTHTMLAGDQATAFAVEMGLQEGSLATDESREMHRRWRDSHCQPNFRRWVAPDPSECCGPYSPLPANSSSRGGGRSSAVGSGTQPDQPAGARPRQQGQPVGQPQLGKLGEEQQQQQQLQQQRQQQQQQKQQQQQQRQQRQRQQRQLWPTEHAHDTIAMVVVGVDGSVAAGSSSNGAIHKVPGRVGDASVPGGGAYADSEVGGCGATGDGDVHLAFSPCYQVVESMRLGMSPTEAAEDAVRRMARRMPTYVGAVVAVSKDGRHGAAAHGWMFVYSVASAGTGGAVETVRVQPLLVAAVGGTGASGTA